VTDTRESMPLSDWIAKRIRLMLISGELRPGQRISEAAFSEHLEVSRNSLREAFRIMTKEGLLRHETNRGVFVQTPTMASIMDIYRVRRMLECGALRKAWRLHESVKVMRQAVEEAKQKREQELWVDVGSANMAFHSAVVALADSERLSELYERVSAELRLGFALIEDPRLLHSPFVDMNDEIVSLCEEDRFAEASEKMEDYLLISENGLLKAFGKLSGKAR